MNKHNKKSSLELEMSKGDSKIDLKTLTFQKKTKKNLDKIGSERANFYQDNKLHNINLQKDFLDLSKKELSYLKLNLMSFKENLLQLDISNNLFKSMPLEILELYKLNFLKLDNNEIYLIPEFVFIKLLRLESLSFANNYVESLSEKIDNCKFLRSLNISKNCIKNLPKNLGIFFIILLFL